MFIRGDFVRIIEPSGHAGMTGWLERVGVQDADVRLTSGGLTVVPLAWLRREHGTPVTLATTAARAALGERGGR